MVAIADRADQGVGLIDGFQLHQLALIVRGYQHRAHLDDVGGDGAPGVEPVAQGVGQRLVAAVDNEITAQQGAAIGRETGVDGGFAGCLRRR